MQHNAAGPESGGVVAGAWVDRERGGGDPV
jgi:hypothetical protein